MALERFITHHRTIVETLAGVNAVRMTALEIHFNDTNNYELAYAIAVVDSAETIDINGKYKDLSAVLVAIGDKRGLGWNNNCNAWEQWEMDSEGEDNDYTLSKADELLAL